MSTLCYADYTMVVDKGVLGGPNFWTCASTRYFINWSVKEGMGGVLNKVWVI